MGNQFSHGRRLAAAVIRFSCYETDREHRASEIVRDGEREGVNSILQFRILWDYGSRL